MKGNFISIEKSTKPNLPKLWTKFRLSRRVEQIESSIMRVIDRVDDVLDRLFDIEKDKVRAKEHQNQLIAQVIRRQLVWLNN